MATHKSDSTALILCVAAVVLMVIAWVTALIMANAVEPVGQSGDQIVRVVEQLDSVSSIRTILFSYAQQYAVTEANLRNALSITLGFLTLGTLLVSALAVALLLQLRKSDALQRQLAPLLAEQRAAQRAKAREERGER